MTLYTFTKLSIQIPTFNNFFCLPLQQSVWISVEFIHIHLSEYIFSFQKKIVVWHKIVKNILFAQQVKEMDFEANWRRTWNFVLGKREKSTVWKLTGGKKRDLVALRLAMRKIDAISHFWTSNVHYLLR